MTDHAEKIPIGISSCLLGHQVRYDGGHKRNSTIKKTLAQHFHFIPFCPETASGMGTPRPPIQLRLTPVGIRGMGVEDHNIDVTEQLLVCADQQRAWLFGIYGYIFKKGSPSCGIETVKIYNSALEAFGSGIFAQYVKDNFPLLPLADENELANPRLRKHFIQRVYAYHDGENY